MDAKQQAHLKMLITTRDVLDNFATIWQNNLAFASARANFGAAIKLIQDEELAQSDTTVGGTQDKRVARGILSDTAAFVGGAVAAWADTQDDHELFAKVDFSAADLLHMPEQDCLTTSQAILDAATQHLADLTAVKCLAQTDLDDLKSAVDDFQTALTRPRQIRSRTKSATDQIPGLMSAADRIVERQLDRLMERFKNLQPDFYAAYQVARVIVSQSGGTSTTPPTPPPPASTASLTSGK